MGISPYGILGQLAPPIKVAKWVNIQGEEMPAFQLLSQAPPLTFIFCYQNGCPSCHIQGFPVLKSLVAYCKHNSIDEADVSFAIIQTVFEARESNQFADNILNLRRYELSLPCGFDDARPRPRFMRDYRTGGTPWWVVIDKRQRVIYNDFYLNFDLATNMIKSHINNESPSHDKTSIEQKVRHDTHNKRFIVMFEGCHNGVLEYKKQQNTLYLMHSQVPLDLRGKGYGKVLMERSLELIEKQGFKVFPVCSYTVQFFKKYKRWSHLLD